MNNPFDLSGRKAIITGGGRGIGLEIARVLARAGADIAIAEINADQAENAAREIRALGRAALPVVTDVRASVSVNAMAEQVISQFGHVDILVNNAGVVVNVPTEDMTDEDWQQVLDVNLNGVFYCCRAVGRHMLGRQSGAIVNIGSMSGVISNMPQPQSAYNASKAAVIHLTKSLAGEWADRNVRVNSVSPGYIGTEMTRRGMSNPDRFKYWMEMTPMKRVGEPVEIANAVWYLASDASTFATGTNLVIDGGYTSW
jgi:NAD(P)-dependent dehydrogenase (short-subunit alcohol dehydrogenase family)